MSATVSPKQIASALAVSESSVKRWCDQGRLTMVRTPGGHRRVALSSVLRFAAESGHPVRDLAALGGEGLSASAAAAVTTGTKADAETVRAALRRGLVGGDLDAVRASLTMGWVQGASVDSLCDDVIAPVFAEIGERWARGSLEIYEERRAVELTCRALYDLGERLAPAANGAPRAIGATTESDPYVLPTVMAELVLRDRGFHATSLGTRLPLHTIIRAVEAIKPELVWLCLGVCDDRVRFVEECAALERATRASGSALVLGGRALVPELRQQLRYSAFCDGMRHLASFADTLRRAETARKAPARRSCDTTDE